MTQEQFFMKPVRLKLCFMCQCMKINIYIKCLGVFYHICHTTSRPVLGPVRQKSGLVGILEESDSRETMRLVG